MEPLGPIWQNLPDDLAFLIISYLDIDTRRAFGLKPQRNRLPMFDLKIKPLMWTPMFNGSAMYFCHIKNRNGKLIYRNQVAYVYFLAPHTMCHIVT